MQQPNAAYTRAQTLTKTLPLCKLHLAAALCSYQLVLKMVLLSDSLTQDGLNPLQLALVVYIYTYIRT